MPPPAPSAWDHPALRFSLQAVVCALLGGYLALLHLAFLVLPSSLELELGWKAIFAVLIGLWMFGFMVFPAGAVAGTLLYLLVRAVGLREDRPGPYAVALLAGAAAALLTGVLGLYPGGIAAIAVCALVGFIVARGRPPRAARAA